MNTKNFVKEYRRKRRLSQKKLADIARVGQQTISNIEVGKHDPSVYIAILIAQALNTTVEKLFKIED